MEFVNLSCRNAQTESAFAAFTCVDDYVEDFSLRGQMRCAKIEKNSGGRSEGCSDSKQEAGDEFQ